MSLSATADAAETGRDDLPKWDLSDLYPGPDSPQLAADLDRMEAQATEFRKRYGGRLAALDGAELGRAVAEYEQMDEVLSRILSFGQLLHATDIENPGIGSFFQSLQERVNGISTNLLFFTIELNAIGDEDLDDRLKAPELARYAPWLRDLRVFRPHQLSDEMERLIHQQHMVGRTAWHRLYDETVAGLRFTIDGREVGATEAVNLINDRSPEMRRRAAEEFGRVLGRNIRTFSLIYNTLAKDKEIEDEWRSYSRPVSSRNKANQVEDEVVEALATAVRSAYPRLSHRYYRLKAGWLGKDKLEIWDRNAPLPQDADRKIGWSEARDLVLSAYRRFSPDLADIGRRFFDNAWIDAPVRPGKAQGAFSHPTVPSAHPYLLLNYAGKTRDVMTLAHELGHGIHQVLAAERGHLLSDTPLTLAETASVFGEMLTFRALLDAETDPARRRVILASKVEDMLNTVVRQIAFHEFETEFHRRRREGELVPEEIGSIWMKIQTDSLGPAFRFGEDYRNWWPYISHFFHAPFYVYAYAFGDCLVNSLYAVYQGAEEGFAERYRQMLAAGGTLRHKELLAPFGLDAGDPEFWSRGLRVIEGMVDELERDAG
jgi:oligoendopeptidase F